MTHGHHRDQGQGWEGVPLPADRLLRRQDRRVHGRARSQRGARQQDARQGHGNAAGGSEAPGAFRPRMPLPAARMAGAHGPLRPGAVDGRQRPFPGRRRRGGVPRTHEDGARLSWALGGGSIPATGCSSRSTTASAGTTTSASNGRLVG